MKNMDTVEAIEKQKQHFANLVPSKEPILMRGMANRGRAVEALQQLLWPEADIKKKFRIIVNYDPEYPIFTLDMFDLN